MTNRTFITIFILIASINLQAQGQGDCVFDTKMQTEEFVKGIPEFSNYVWNDELKEATIKLKDGKVLIAKKGGCNHFEVKGTLIVQNQLLASVTIKQLIIQAKWIAKRIFDESDFVELEETLDNQKYKFSNDDDQMMFISLNHGYFSEYYIP